MSIQAPDFDSIKQINPYGAEYWSARDLMPLLGYARRERRKQLKQSSQQDKPQEIEQEKLFE